MLSKILESLPPSGGFSFGFQRAVFNSNVANFVKKSGQIGTWAYHNFEIFTVLKSLAKCFEGRNTINRICARSVMNIKLLY